MIDALCPYFFSSYLATLFNVSHFLTAVFSNSCALHTLCTMADLIVKLHLFWHIAVCGLTIGLLKQTIVIISYFPWLHIISHRALLLSLMWAYLNRFILKINSKYHIIFSLMAQDWFAIFQESYLHYYIARLIAEIRKVCNQDIPTCLISGCLLLIIFFSTIHAFLHETSIHF